MIELWIEREPHDVGFSFKRHPELRMSPNSEIPNPFSLYVIYFHKDGMQCHRYLHRLSVLSSEKVICGLQYVRENLLDLVIKAR